MSEKPSVMIGCPWYVQVRPETAFSMAQTYLRLAMDGPAFISGVFDCPSIGLARARLVAQFMASDCTHLLAVDSDMSWNVEAVLRLLEHDVPFVAVAGRDKRNGRIYFGAPNTGGGDKVPFGYDATKGLLSVARVGGCFMLIRRDCIETLMATYPDLWLAKQEIDDKLRPFFYAFFETKAQDGWWPTEDFRFSDLLRGADIPVLVDAWVELGHIVPQELRGKAIDYLEFPDELEPLPNQGVGRWP